ncbi:hypothetical protein PVK06_012605 [Gossypium arboreum]|uniref:Uncharacterized protein n=1 Tax=Gossypium arboreum TaxID=29729 RepID=A0ABR0QC53_GOSAR|nr:hypothetical protein PVK06_012605 [Gossypium arboreum]
METGKGTRASWTWSSLVEAKDFLKELLLCQVNNGEKINIWEEKWVYGLDGYRLNFPETVEPLMPKLVVDIMNKKEGRWNISLIEQWISEQEKEAIMRLPICKTEEEDKLVWPHSIGGNYEVKSDYNMLRTEKVMKAQLSLNSFSHRVDKKI